MIVAFPHQPVNRRRVACLLMAATALMFTGCGAEKSGASSGKKRIVTSFTIIADMAREVAGTAAEVESITKPGAEIHGYEPTPKDIVKAQQADLVLWNGMNLEVWFEKFFQNLKDVPGVIISEGIEPMGITTGPYTGKPNPHAWMSPANAAIYVENIRKALVKIDPANESVYTANAAAYTAKIKALDEPVRQKLAAIPEARRWLVTSEGRVFLSLPELWSESPLPLADQRRCPGDAPAGEGRYRRRARTPGPRRLFRKHHQSANPSNKSPGKPEPVMAACFMSIP